MPRWPCNDLAPVLSLVRSGDMTASDRHAQSCQGKVGYATEAEARQQVRFLKQRTVVHSRVGVYRCTACGFFHIGKRKAKRAA